MNKKWKVVISVVAGVVALTAVFGGVALADEKGDCSYDCAQVQMQRCGEGQGLVMGRVIGLGTLTELLGIDADEVREQRQEGKSLAEIAAEQGVDENTLVSTLVSVVGVNIQQRVDAGIITQERADLLLELVTERVTNAVNRTEIGSVGQGQRPGFASRAHGGRLGGGRYGGNGIGMQRVQSFS
ncbi:MAG: hypothetical protein J7L90_03445 [Dehalococcoidia bacterium]|nr:hypothetical protein [Dehalococcoidia bacterium]